MWAYFAQERVISFLLSLKSLPKAFKPTQELTAFVYFAAFSIIYYYCIIEILSTLVHFMEYILHVNK